MTTSTANAPAGAGLSVDGINVAFGGLAALTDVSLQVLPGEVVGVIGPNGAGKTTLFNIICGFVTPLSGTITYNGHTIDGRKPHHLTRLGIARTLQGVGLWNGLSIIDNVMAGGEAKVRAGLTSSILGLWRSSREETRLRRRASELLHELEIDQFAEAHPSALPYAVQKRTALARALMADPTLLLLDEPASGLSQGEMDELSARLIAMRASASVLLVEHHMDLVMSTCDRLVVLNFGQVIAQGTPAEVKANPEVTTAYLGDEVQPIGAAVGSATGPAPGVGPDGPGTARGGNDA
ncbi:MAG TPA: ABC transporter ATP-binding protein [Acidimicrobiales bacterium]|jgi:branched-chain amino acid transport system ATP-binding protein|nr:ABC transporter ATP-binding protein [Acidimicrobiales bacterium]